MRVALIMLVFVLAVCLTGIGGCGQNPVEKKAVKIAINVWPGYAHAFLAQEKGFYKKNNVDVELILKTSPQESQELFINGEVDGVFDSMGSIVQFASKNVKASIIYIADYSIDGDVIIGRPEIQSLAELDGKTVSVEGFNSFSHVFVLNSIISAGLEEGRVKFENIPALDVLEALDAKKIDAGHTWEPEKSQALKKGYKVLARAGDTPGIITDVLFLKNKVIAERSEDVQAIVKSLVEAQDDQKKNREESLKIMASKMNMSVEEMASGLDGVCSTGLNDNLAMMTEKMPSATVASASATASTTAGPSLFTAGSLVVDFYLNRGQLTQKIEMSDIVEPKFIKNLAGK
ncbi:MAG: ABC transporter substrate-binding protein [Candidatus Riflebacteria bacterium]|nr:ABC transporter substrate-binding protein [Candidatus Riflebacteria bacterium]